MIRFVGLLVLAFIAQANAQSGPNGGVVGPGGAASVFTGFANPSATAGPSAVNGVATTGLRSDSSPAIQKGTNTQFGIIESDGSTIICTSGVCVVASITLGSVSVAPGSSLTTTQLTAQINTATASLSGALPAWPNNTTTYFRGDGTYATLNYAAVAGLGSMAEQSSSSVSITGGAITGMPSPSGATDVATKQYVDNSATGLTVHTAVTLATTTALPTNTYNNGTSGVGATLTATSDGVITIDGADITLNERVLVKNESAAANNGIYTVTTVGTSGAAYVLTRAADANTPGTANPNEIGYGTYVLVTAGTANTATGWSVTSTVATIGTSAINWAQFSASVTGVTSLGGLSGILALGTGLTSSSQTINTPWTISSANIYFNLGGNVGIGTSSPGFLLHEYANNGTFELQELQQAGTAGVLTRYVDNTGDIVAFGSEGGSASIRTNNTQRLAITIGGLVGVGTASPSGNVDIENGSDTATGCLNSSCVNSFSGPWGQMAGNIDCTGSTAADTLLSNAFTSNSVVMVPPNCTVRFTSPASPAVPKGKQLIVPCGSMIKPDSGATFLIEGTIPDPGLCQIFSGMGTVTGLNLVRAEYWGAANNGSTDSTAALNAADASMVAAATNGSDGSPVLTLGCGSGYLISGSVTFHPSQANNEQIIGGGSTSCTEIVGSSGGTFSGNHNCLVCVIPATSSVAQDFAMKNVSIFSQTQNQNVQCLNLGDSTTRLQGQTRELVLENINISNCNTGIGLYNTRNWFFNRVGISPGYPGGAFTASSSTTNLTVTSVTGQVVVGTTLSGNACVPGGTTILSQTSGTPQGAGVYVTSGSTTCSGASLISGTGLTSASIGMIFDSDNGGDFSGDSDMVGGQINCIGSGSGASGGANVGIRLRSEQGASGGSNIAGLRFSGVVWYGCADAFLASTRYSSTLGDIWVNPGSQFDPGGGASTGTFFSGTTNGGIAKAMVNINFDNLYVTQQTNAPTFSFVGDTTEAIRDISIVNVRANGNSGSIGYFAFIENAVDLTIANNRLVYFSGTAGPPALVYLDNVTNFAVTGNACAPDGINNSVGYLVDVAGSTDYGAVTGNMFGVCVTSTINASMTHQAVGTNYP